MNDVPQEIHQHGGAIATLTEITKAAEIVAKSGLFGIKSAEQAATLMLVAQAEGSHIMTAMREFHIIDGKPSLKADAMLARFQKAGGSVKWITRSDTVCKAVFSHTQGGSLEVEWTKEMADKAGFSWSLKKEWAKTKDGKGFLVVVKDNNGNPVKEPKDNWVRMPRQMLAARVISEGIRAVCAGCLNGFYTPEEIADFAQSPEPCHAEASVVQTSEPKPIKKPEPALDALIDESEAALEAPISQPAADNYYAPHSPAPATPPQPRWVKTLCEFMGTLPDRNKAGEVLRKYCDPKKINTLGYQQVQALMTELSTIFDVYMPVIDMGEEDF